MECNFEIFKLDNEIYDFLIIATSYKNPLSSFNEIEEKIQVKKACLIFDLTLINGVKKNRYIKCEYEANKNKLPTCSIVENIETSIKEISYKYFKKNEHIIQESVIPDALKYLLKSGMI